MNLNKKTIQAFGQVQFVPDLHFALMYPVCFRSWTRAASLIQHHERPCTDDADAKVQAVHGIGCSVCRHNSKQSAALSLATPPLRRSPFGKLRPSSALGGSCGWH